jgi:hypothetical protein
MNVHFFILMLIEPQGIVLLYRLGFVTSVQDVFSFVFRFNLPFSYDN